MGAFGVNETYTTELHVFNLQSTSTRYTCVSATRVGYVFPEYSGYSLRLEQTPYAANQCTKYVPFQMLNADAIAHTNPRMNPQVR